MPAHSTMEPSAGDGRGRPAREPRDRSRRSVARLELGDTGRYPAHTMTASIPDLLLALPGWAVLIAVFLLPALESSAFIGFLFPGEIAVILGGVAAAAGRMPLPAMIAAAILGAVIGDSIGYAIGKRWGHQMLDGTLGRLPIVRHELGKHLESAKAFVRKRGPHAVFIGRFTAALRVLVPGLSGMAELPYPTFL